MFALWIALSVGVVTSLPTQPSCPQCVISDCVVPAGCISGVTKDRCQCCDVCGLAEGERCEIPGVDSACGANMTCRTLTPSAEVSKCVCDYPDELCGSDGKTYRNICHMKEVVNAERRRGLTVAARGPCRRKPFLVSGPEHTTNRTGGYIALSCEADGYPIPTIEWIFTKVDGKVQYLPGDNGYVSVNLRGGPERHQITGWVQLMDLQKEHEGDYTCMAHNELGKVEKQARVIIEN